MTTPYVLLPSIYSSLASVLSMENIYKSLAHLNKSFRAQIFKALGAKKLVHLWLSPTVVENILESIRDVAFFAVWTVQASRVKF